MSEVRDRKMSLYEWCVEYGEDWIYAYDMEKNGIDMNDIPGGTSKDVYFCIYFDKENKKFLFRKDVKDFEKMQQINLIVKPTNITKDYRRNKGMFNPFTADRNTWGLPYLNALGTERPMLAAEWDNIQNCNLLAPNHQAANILNIPISNNVPATWKRYLDLGNGKCTPVTWQQSVRDRINNSQSMTFVRLDDELELISDSENLIPLDSLPQKDQLLDNEVFELESINSKETTLIFRKYEFDKYADPLISNDRNRINTVPCIKNVNDLFSTHPELAYEIDYAECKKHGIDIDHIHKDMTDKIYWKSKYADTESWPASPVERISGKCAEQKHRYGTSFPEQAIYYYIKKYFPDAVNGDRKQLEYAAIGPDEKEKIYRKELDVYIPELRTAIEYDGQAWHTSKERDEEKNRMCEERNIRLVRIREKKCPKLRSTSNMRVMVFAENTSNELKRSIEFVLKECGINRKSIDVDINRDRNEIKKQYIKEIEQEYPNGHLLIPGHLFERYVSLNDREQVKKVCFVNRKRIPKDHISLSDEVSENSSMNDSIVGWRDGEVYYISTTDNSKIYLNETHYKVLSCFPKLSSVKIENIEEKTGNDIKQLIYPLRNREDIELIGTNLSKLGLKRKEKIEIIDIEDILTNNVFNPVTGNRIAEKATDEATRSTLVYMTELINQIENHTYYEPVKQERTTETKLQNDIQILRDEIIEHLENEGKQSEVIKNYINRIKSEGKLHMLDNITRDKTIKNLITKERYDAIATNIKKVNEKKNELRKKKNRNKSKDDMCK